LGQRACIVLKFGGELLEGPDDVQRMAAGIRALAARAPLVVVHGGGKEIDAGLAVAGIPKRQVDGLRVTDEATLGVVVAVLAGTINVRLVSAVRQAGGRAVGLTGVDAGVAAMKRAKPITSTGGDIVDLGLVGTPAGGARPDLLLDLVRRGYVPIVSCLAATAKGGRVVCAGIHMSDIPAFPYRLLWEERQVLSVANLTRSDGHEFFDIASQAGIVTETVSYPLARANEALSDLRTSRLQGAAVLVP